MNLGITFNEGVGCGGFASVIDTNTFIFDPFTVTPEVMIIKSKNALGVTTRKEGIKTDATASATVQVPFDNANNPIWLQEGDSFTDPDGDVWWVSEAPKERRSGETHKQNMKCELRLN